MDDEIEKKVKDALVQTKGSLFLTLLSIPFTILGLILIQTSSFAAEVLGISIVTFLIYLPLTIYWYRTWKRLTKNESRE